MRADSYKIAVIGGDQRQICLAQILASRGCDISVCGLCGSVGKAGVRETAALEEALEGADAVAAPVPFFREGKIAGKYTVPDMNVETLLGRMPASSKLFAGNIPEDIGRRAGEKGIEVYDVMRDEITAMRNTVAAAEGAVAEAITRSTVNLTRSRCLVLGYGRCGSTLVRLLKAFSCTVFVAEKDGSRAAAAAVAADGIVSDAELAAVIEKADFIFNTVPEMVLTKERMSCAGERTWILDLASAPGGVDHRAAEELGVNAVLLPGLPGRYAPYSSAEILADLIESRIGIR